MAEFNFDKERSVAGGSRNSEQEISSFAPYRARSKSPRASPRALGNREEDKMYAGSASATGKDVETSLAVPGVEPEAYGKQAIEGLKHKAPAGSASKGKELMGQEMPLAISDRKYEKYEAKNTGSASEVSYKAMTADSISGAHREYKSTLEDIGGFTLMDRDDDTTFVDKRKIEALAIGDQSGQKGRGQCRRRARKTGYAKGRCE